MNLDQRLKLERRLYELKLHRGVKPPRLQIEEMPQPAAPVVVLPGFYQTKPIWIEREWE